MDLVKQKETIIENIKTLIELYEEDLPMYDLVNDKCIEKFIGNSTLIATDKGATFNDGKTITQFYTEGKAIEKNLETKETRLMICKEPNQLEKLKTVKSLVDELIETETVIQKG